jgi:uncharacterized protein (TIGR02646 family)
MRSVDKGGHPTRPDGEPVRFADYQDAGPYLKARLGRYCSYCERFIASSLAVEHKLPKDEGQWPELRLEWSNFLLACANCNSTKLNNPKKPLQVSDFPWPDVEDCFDMVTYRASGKVDAQQDLPLDQRVRIERLLDLLGLRKQPKELSNTDDRYADRLRAWRLAEQSKADLTNRPSEEMQHQIVENAQGRGNFSVWMTVFTDHPLMQEAFAKAFPGTRWSKPSADHGSQPA